MEVDEFIDQTRPCQMTLGDVLRLPIDQPFEVVIW